MKKIIASALFALFLIGCAGSQKPLADAIKTNDKAQIQVALEKQYVNINEPLNGRMTALMFAIRRGASLETIKFLVEKGADINAVNNVKQDAVYYSVYYNRLDVLKYLLSLKATSKASNEQLKAVAIQKNYPQMLEFLETLK